MSRLGKKPVAVTSGAKVSIAGQTIKVEGAKGKLEFVAPQGITVAEDAGKKELVVTRSGDDKQSRAYHGLTRAMLANMVQGVVKGYSKVLEVRGVGFKAELKGKTLVLNLGYASPVTVPVPATVAVKVEPGVGDITNKITIDGADKQQVGNFAASVRKVKKPEPYKGKGIRYEGEAVKTKPGKAFAGAGSK
jgi:large subunit ribosomal protein L6